MSQELTKETKISIQTDASADTKESSTVPSPTDDLSEDVVDLRPGAGKFIFYIYLVFIFCNTCKMQIQQAESRDACLV